VRAKLGVLPDARGVYKRLTARENIEYFGACTADEAEIARRAKALIAALDMQDIRAAHRRLLARASAPRPRSRARWCTTRAT
jgi:sodium transport system ATP-binding protein